MGEIAVCILFCVIEPAPAASAHTSDFCEVAKPILWHKDDTRATKEQADKHNRTYKAICRGVK